jgi:hypothetical protein
MTRPISVEGFSKSMSARKAGHSRLTSDLAAENCGVP